MERRMVLQTSGRLSQHSSSAAGSTHLRRRCSVHRMRPRTARRRWNTSCPGLQQCLQIPRRPGMCGTRSTSRWSRALTACRARPHTWSGTPGSGWQCSAPPSHCTTTASLATASAATTCSACMTTTGTSWRPNTHSLCRCTAGLLCRAWTSCPWPLCSTTWSGGCLRACTGCPPASQTRDRCCAWRALTCRSARRSGTATPAGAPSSPPAYPRPSSAPSHRASWSTACRACAPSVVASAGMSSTA
mmetsp:Transcript_38059/g.84750  ORF Transcript_38059/g.84750 Transcript_38059/m.84750 type:complete len:245 (+) Transcript_38059:607-1341(+)